MNHVQRIVHRVRRRLLLSDLLGWLGVGLLIALGAAVVLLVLDRRVGIAVPIAAYGVLAGAVVLGAALAASMRRPGDAAVAEMIDHRLGLKDRLATAMYIEGERGRLDADPFARRAVDDARQAASGARVEKAFPVRPGRVWGWALPLAAGLALAMVFLPGGGDLLGLGHAGAQRKQQARADDAADAKILQARALVKPPGSEGKMEEADSKQIDKALASLTREDLRTPQARQKAAARLSDIRESLHRSRQAKEKAFRSMRNAMSAMDAGQRGPADKLADAMRRGDYAAAQRELKALTRKMQNGQFSPKQRHQLQKQLQNLSAQMKAMSRRQANRGAGAGKQAARTLRKQGLSPQQIQQIQRQGMSQQAVRQAVQKSLQRRGMSASQAKRRARQVAQKVNQQQRSGQSQQRSSSFMNGLANSMGMMSQAVAHGQQGQRNQSGQQGRQTRQGKQGQQGSRFGQGSWSAQQQLQQMQRMQRQLNRMGQANRKLGQAMRGMSRGRGPGKAPQPGQGMSRGQGRGKAPQPGRGMSRGQGQGRGQKHGPRGGAQQGQRGGVGGRRAGVGSGGNPLGRPYKPGQYKTQNAPDLQQGHGRVIASWMQKGDSAVGESSVGFDKAVTDAKAQAQQAVTDDRVPRRYDQSIKDYFRQLPQSPDQVRRAPPAPR